LAEPVDLVHQLPRHRGLVVHPLLQGADLAMLGRDLIPLS
jgi:hypothetical protein